MYLQKRVPSQEIDLSYFGNYRKLEEQLNGIDSDYQFVMNI